MQSRPKTLTDNCKYQKACFKYTTMFKRNVLMLWILNCRFIFQKWYDHSI